MDKEVTVVTLSAVVVHSFINMQVVQEILQLFRLVYNSQIRSSIVNNLREKVTTTSCIVFPGTSHRDVISE